MTTLVATQRALELLSMSNQQGRRQSKRLAGTFIPGAGMHESCMGGKYADIGDSRG